MFMKHSYIPTISQILVDWKLNKFYIETSDHFRPLYLKFWRNIIDTWTQSDILGCPSILVHRLCSRLKIPPPAPLKSSNCRNLHCTCFYLLSSNHLLDFFLNCQIIALSTLFLLQTWKQETFLIPTVSLCFYSPWFVCSAYTFHPLENKKHTQMGKKNVVWPLSITQVEVFAFAKSLDELQYKNLLLYSNVSQQSVWRL